MVDRKKRSSWFPDVNLSTVTDSSIRIDFGDEGLAIGKVLSVNRPSEFVHTLVWEDMPTTEVSWSFMRVDDDHTMVVLTHQNITSGASVDWAVGWHVILDDLVACVDHKKAPLPDFEELGKYYSKQLAI